MGKNTKKSIWKSKLIERCVFYCILVNTCTYVYMYNVIIHEWTVSILILMKESNNRIEWFLSVKWASFVILKFQDWGVWYFFILSMCTNYFWVSVLVYRIRINLSGNFGECFYMYIQILLSSTQVQQFHIS